MRYLFGRSAAGIVCLIFSLASYCTAWAQEFPLRMPSEQPTDARAIADYADAIDAIVWVMVKKYGLPVPRGTVEVHATRESFEKGLIKHLKISPAIARKVSEFSKSAVGSYTLLINGPAVANLSWPERTELLAHEVTHTLQLTLANRPGIARPQWLIEGYAEWLAFNVTDALGLDDLGRARARMTEKLRDLRRKGDLPNLLQVDTFPDWTETRKKYGFDATYPLAFLITDFLVERHSFSAVTDYFRQFQKSEDHAANFKVALGEELDEFDRALQPHLEQLLGEGGK